MGKSQAKAGQRKVDRCRERSAGEGARASALNPLGRR